MEIALLEGNTIRIKGKSGTLIFDPSKNIKMTADAVLFLTTSASINISKELRESSRVIINGPGEYEIGGMKIAAFKYENELLYSLIIEGADVLIAKSNVLERAHGKQKDTEILICNADAVAGPSSILSLSPRVALVYGDKSMDIIKGLGKESTSKTTKYTISADKLPAEMEIVLLG